MRFWLESSARRTKATVVATSALTLAALLPAACSEGDKASQDQAALSCDVSYENFAGPFLLNWCVGCHSSSLGMGDRQNAPLGMDFDTLSGIQGHEELARLRVVELRTMPPVGGPSEAERELFGKWLDCGMPAEGKGFIPPPPTGKPVVVPAPTGTCAEPRTALPASVLPRCQAATLDCVVQCSVDNPDYNADACREACLAADPTPVDASLGTPINCATCTLGQLLACTDSSGCHDETAAFVCCLEACGGAPQCDAKCNGELQAFGICAYYTAPDCLDFLDGPMSACFAAPDPNAPVGAGGAASAGGAGSGGAAN